MQSRSCLKGLKPSELLHGIVSHIYYRCVLYLLSSINKTFNALVVVGCCTAFQVGAICRKKSRNFFIGGFQTKFGGGGRVLAVYFYETMSKLIVPNLPGHIWPLYVVFTRFSDERRQARSERGTPDTKHARQGKHFSVAHVFRFPLVFARLKNAKK